MSNLLSLDLIGCQHLEKLPGEMSNLINLRHLLLYGCDRLGQMPIGLGNLTNLQRLDYFVAKQSGPGDSGGELAELKALNNLEGELRIVLGGRHCESSAANLQMKDKLMAFILDLTSSEENHKDVLEGLQPHAHLRHLNIYGYNGESLPSWMMKNQLHCSLPNLVSIVITGGYNSKVTSLCSFGRLPHLQRLCLREFNSVEYIEEDEDNAPVNEDTVSRVAPLFPSLRELRLWKMPKLKGWQRDSRNNMGSARPPSFSRLEHLTLHKVGFEVLPDELRGLSSLQSLDIQRCKRLKEIPEWIGNFTSFRTLYIYGCLNLMPLPMQIGNLPNLELISIKRCRGAYAEWWADPTLPECPIKQLPTDKEWKWEYTSHDSFCCSKYRNAQNSCR